MHGNVTEWCYDCYADREPTPVVDPLGPLAGSYRVFRGGDWDQNEWFCPSGIRRAYNSTLRFNDLGLRVARGPYGSKRVIGAESGSQVKSSTE